MSLGSWFRDNVYIPLGGNQKGFKRQILNLAVVWLLTGFWHGAAWNFILWGIYYGILIIIEKLFLLKWLEKHNVMSHIYTLFLVLIGWALFAIEDFSVLGCYLSGLFGNSTIGFVDNQFIYYLQNYGVLLIVGIIAAICPLRQHYHILKAQRHWVKVVENILLIVLFVLALAMLVNSTYNPFLYFRF